MAGLPLRTPERPVGQHPFGEYLLCCTASGESSQSELVIPRPGERARVRAQHLLCWQGRPASQPPSPRTEDESKRRTIDTSNLEQAAPMPHTPTPVAAAAAGGGTWEPPEPATPTDLELPSSILPESMETAARLIQGKWRLRGQTKAAKFIQKKWRRRLEKRLTSELAAEETEERSAEQSPLEIAKMLSEQPKRTLNRAASQIQRLWRTRMSSREAASVTSPEPAAQMLKESLMQRLQVPEREWTGKSQKSPSAESAEMWDVAPATPTPGSIPATTLYQRRSPAISAEAVASPSEASPITEALGKAAALVQSMWRPTSVDSQQDLTLGEEAVEGSAERVVHFASDPPAASPISSALGDAAQRIQAFWRSRLPSTEEEPPLEAEVDAHYAQLAREEGEGATLWEHFNGATEWLVGKAKATSAASEPLLKAWWTERKRRALQTLLQSSQPVLKRTLADIGEVVKGSVTADPDMWPCVRNSAQTAASEVWSDIEMEIEESLRFSLMSQSNYFDKPPTSTNPVVRLWLSVRSVLLYHYLPYNKSIFGKLKDPGYVFMTCSTMLPVFGIRVFFFSVILVCLLLPGPPDEYQLINFILLLKGTQFFTTGVGMMFVGAMKYYLCYLFHGDELQTCIMTKGPGAADYLASAVFDYFGTIILVWTAFLALPRSKVHWSGHRVSDEHTNKTYCCCLTGVPTRGGRLRWLLRYDMVTFVFSFMFFFTVYMDDLSLVMSGRSEKWNRHLAFLHAKETVFWCRILYSIFSLPFVIFVIPLCGRILTHSVYTGYNEAGACVEFSYEVTDDEQPELSRRSDRE